MSISLPQNLASAQNLEDLKRQSGELVKVLEDYLNRSVSVYYRENPNLPNPTMKKGDLLIDTTVSAPNTVLLEWNGSELVPIFFGGATGPTGATGTAGVGVPAGGRTGSTLTKLSNSDYDTGWITQEEFFASSGFEPVSNGEFPDVLSPAIVQPQIVFDDLTADVVMSG